MKPGKPGGGTGDGGNWEWGGPGKWEQVSSHFAHAGQVMSSTCVFGFPFHDHCPMQCGQRSTPMHANLHYLRPHLTYLQPHRSPHRNHNPHSTQHHHHIIQHNPQPNHLLPPPPPPNTALTLIYTPQKYVDASSASSADSSGTKSALSGTGFSDLDTYPTPVIVCPGRYQRPALSGSSALQNLCFFCYHTYRCLSFYFVIASIAPPALHEEQPRFNFSGEVVLISPFALRATAGITLWLTTYGTTVSHVIRPQQYIMHVVFIIWRPAFGGRDTMFLHCRDRQFQVTLFSPLQSPPWRNVGIIS